MKKFSILSGNCEQRCELRLPGICIVDGNEHRIDAVRLLDGRIHLLLDGTSHLISESNEPSMRRTSVRNREITFTLETAESKLIRAALGNRHADPDIVELRAPMPGLVSRCEISEGAFVESGQGLLILDAMKMENELKAPVKGTVTKLHVKEKEAVEKGQLLITIQQ
ncbi:MAG: biotin/lipoyl-binding protein [Ignavibacteriales bacterium]|nr:biotin/lipoyl-binding protein [Ignavibacteriales bacterium]